MKKRSTQFVFILVAFVLIIVLTGCGSVNKLTPENLVGEWNCASAFEEGDLILTFYPDLTTIDFNDGEYSLSGTYMVLEESSLNVAIFGSSVVFNVSEFTKNSFNLMQEDGDGTTVTCTKS